MREPCQDYRTTTAAGPAGGEAEQESEEDGVPGEEPFMLLPHQH